ncbi:hypothetical protein SCP_1301660 [Sparassis crispa]|uniref:NmrA-like domain-containing protein n=1 Tax=Sparassis crispa TaxID=139825 RepID=A0A401H1P4_9APHY|nr:hypothetical protein SCP_1301660 [Sparassis crispa]GBE88351.1 hypothetical protein SCP_1301660 [Sparassis crispa]
MSHKTSILLIGATGYIGGSVLTRLMKHPNASNFDITVLVRSEEKAKKLEAFGVHTVIGSFGDTEKLEALASKASIVFNCADADDLGAARAILRGMQKRHTEAGEIPTLIHTSGTGIVTDNAAGMYPMSTIYYDSDPDQIETLSPTQMHRNVDLSIVNADAKGTIKSYIILPSDIYGLASGSLVNAGIMNPHSVQIPLLIKASLDRGRGGMVGEGKNIWPNVHIDEVADLYIVVFDAVMSGKPIGHGREGFYFAENGEHQLYDIGKAIGAALVDLGMAKSDEPTTFSKAELDKYFGGSADLGTNSRCRAERSRAIGWKPVKGTRDMLASVRPEIDNMIARPESVKI